MQNKLFYDDEYEALALMVSNCPKGAKALAGFLFPHLKPDSAYARLKSCLNPDRDERMTFGQIIAAMRFCDSYEPLLYACDETQHKRPERVVLDEQKSELARTIADASETLRRATEALERLGSGGNGMSVGDVLRETRSGVR